MIMCMTFLYAGIIVCVVNFNSKNVLRTKRQLNNNIKKKIQENVISLFFVELFFLKILFVTRFSYKLRGYWQWIL